MLSLWKLHVGCNDIVALIFTLLLGWVVFCIHDSYISLFSNRRGRLATGVVCRGRFLYYQRYVIWIFMSPSDTMEIILNCAFRYILTPKKGKLPEESKFHLNTEEVLSGCEWWSVVLYRFYMLNYSWSVSVAVLKIVEQYRLQIAECSYCIPCWCTQWLHRRIPEKYYCHNESCINQRREIVPNRQLNCRKHYKYLNILGW